MLRLSTENKQLNVATVMRVTPTTIFLREGGALVTLDRAQCAPAEIKVGDRVQRVGDRLLIVEMK